MSDDSKSSAKSLEAGNRRAAVAVAMPLIIVAVLTFKWTGFRAERTPVTMGRPFELTLRTGVETIGGVYRIDRMRATLRVGDQGDSIPLVAEPVNPPPWGVEFEGNIEEVALVMRTEIPHGDWDNKPAEITWEFAFTYPKLLADTIEQHVATRFNYENSEITDTFVSKVKLVHARLRTFWPRVLFIVTSVLALFILAGAAFSWEEERRARCAARSLPPIAASPEALRQYREDRRNQYVKLARVSLVALIVANSIIAVAVAYGIWRAAETHRLRTIIAFVPLSWGIAAWVRSKRVTHLRLIRGLSQPYAEEVVADTPGEADTYVLFLRGFEMEAQQNQYSGVNEDASTIDARIAVRPVEGALVDFLAHPIITLADPRHRDPMPGAHRFAVIPDDWQSFVYQLVDNATIVVLHLVSLTPGIRYEVELLRNVGAKKTLVIAGPAVLANPEGIVENLCDDGSDQFFVVSERTGPNWSRSEERAFRSRLVESLQEAESRLGTHLVVPTPRQRLTTPTVIGRIFEFFIGPLFAVVGLCIVWGIIALWFIFSGKLEIVSGWRSSVEWLGLSVVAVPLLAAVKGYFLVDRALQRAGRRHAERLWRKK